MADIPTLNDARLTAETLIDGEVALSIKNPGRVSAGARLGPDGMLILRNWLDAAIAPPDH